MKNYSTDNLLTDLVSIFERFNEKGYWIKRQYRDQILTQFAVHEGKMKVANMLAITRNPAEGIASKTEFVRAILAAIVGANERSQWQATWKAALAPGYRFDYEEGTFRVTVEVERLAKGELVELSLRVVDDAYSRPEPPHKGDVFKASYDGDTDPGLLWRPHAEGYFARSAAELSSKGYCS